MTFYYYERDIVEPSTPPSPKVVNAISMGRRTSFSSLSPSSSSNDINSLSSSTVGGISSFSYISVSSSESSGEDFPSIFHEEPAPPANIFELLNEDEYQPIISDPEDEPKPILQVVEDRRVLTAGSLAIMLYFWTSGGPFGFEPAVGAAGPVIALIGAIIITLIWSLPQALMSAELSLMMEENGGNVLWVNRAFGNFIGFVNAQCNLIQNLVNQALVVLMFLSYLPLAESLLDNFWVKLGLCGAFTFLNLVLNIFGMSFLEKLSWVLFFAINTPFFVEWGLIGFEWHSKGYSFASLDTFPFDKVNWSLLISTLVWSYGGFDSIGSLAGEVSGGARTYLLGIFLAMPLIQLNYIGPVISGWLVLPDRSNWKAGTFGVVAPLLASWFGYWVVGAACTSSFATSSTARNAWAMSLGLEGIPSLPRFLSYSWRGQPFASLCFCSAASLALAMWMPFDKLIQVYFVVRLANLLLEFLSLIKLRWSEPDTPRPFKIACGWFGIAVTVTPTFIIGIFALAHMPSESLIVGFSTVGAVIVIYFFYYIARQIIIYNPLDYSLFEDAYIRTEFEGDLLINADYSDD